MGNAFFDYAQIKRSFYMFFFPLPFAGMAVSMNALAFIDGLWADWSPGYNGKEDVAHVKDCLRDAPNLEAAIGYYRAMFDASKHDPALAAEQAATTQVPPQPTLYLHGTTDGCLAAELADGAGALLGPQSAVRLVKGAGHFLQVEK